MSLSDALIKYLDRKFDRHYKTQNLLLEQQNALLQGLLDYVMGPANQEQHLGSAEEDGIDDSHGEFDIDKHAEEQIKAQWVKDGYPDKIAQYLR